MPAAKGFAISAVRALILLSLWNVGFVDATTLVAARFEGGVVIGADSRTSQGSFVANRLTDKITLVSPGIFLARSGSSAGAFSNSQRGWILQRAPGTGLQNGVGARCTEYGSEVNFGYRLEGQVHRLVCRLQKYEEGKPLVLAMIRLLSCTTTWRKKHVTRLLAVDARVELLLCSLVLPSSGFP